jgi:hypothetical protein
MLSLKIGRVKSKIPKSSGHIGHMIIMENMVIKLSNISQTITIIIIQLSQNGVTKNGKIGHKTPSSSLRLPGATGGIFLCVRITRGRRDVVVKTR